MKERNYDAATEAKTQVEDQQRKYRAIREEKDVEWKPQHFYLDENGVDWICKYSKYLFFLISLSLFSYLIFFLNRNEPFTKEYLEEIEKIIFTQIKDPDMTCGEN